MPELIGSLDSRRRPLVRVPVSGKDDLLAIIDTAFTGELLVDDDVARSWGVVVLDVEAQIEMGDGSRRDVKQGLLTVVWFGREHDATVQVVGRSANGGTMSADKARAAELKRLANMKDEDIDTSDIPEVTDWSRAEVGKFYRPVKKQVTLRIDADVLAWFKSQSARYQTEINSVLRERFLKSMKNPSPSAFHARTGEICPQSGTWTLVGDPRTSISVSKGDRMPSLKKRRVVWVQLKAA